MTGFVGAIDQGTTSTRFMVFDHEGRAVSAHQAEHRQILPKPGWVEHDPAEIWRKTQDVVEAALARAGLTAADLAAVGITNQRETTVVWDRETGRPYYNAIVWQDTRTAEQVAAIGRGGAAEVIRARTGLTPAAYFSASKIRWLLDHADGLAAAARAGRAVFGTIDTWLLWNLTGGRSGGVHVTDPTNVSRTMLMELATLQWDEDLLAMFGIPREMLPAIRPSADPGAYGTTRAGGPFRGEVALTADLGDQQAATLGQLCLEPGTAKSTYGTGNFVLVNTGSSIAASAHGLLSTVAYQFGAAAPAYALEGAIAVTGSAIQWLRDQLGIISSAAESEELARTVPDTAGLYFVPAFSGLFAPHWRPDARGAIVGLSRFHTRAHLARAALESICHQTRDVVLAMEKDCGVPLDVLKVDGGATSNDLAMQMQADILGVPVSRPEVIETTALGAAYAAGLATGFWSSPQELKGNWRESRRWDPAWTPERRAEAHHGWRKAIERTLDWIDVA